MGRRVAASLSFEIKLQFEKGVGFPLLPIRRIIRLPPEFWAEFCREERRGRK
jgi:hypothetical protein